MAKPVQSDLVVNGKVTLEHLAFAPNSGGFLFIDFDASAGHLGGIRFEEAADEIVLYVEDGATLLTLGPGLLTVGGGLSVDGNVAIEGSVEISDASGAPMLTLEGDGFGASHIRFHDPDSGEEGEIFYDPDLDLMRFTVGAETALVLEESRVTLLADGITAARTMFDSGTGNSGFVIFGDGSAKGHLIGTADSWVMLASDSGIKLRPAGLASTTREIVWTASSAAPQFRDSGGTLRDMAVMRQGTWTPSLTGSTGDPFITYSLQDGKYLRIGDLVFVSAHITISAISLGTGQALIHGLPFTVWNANGYRTNFNIALSGVGWPASRSAPWASGMQNQISVGLVAQGDNVGFGAIAITSFAAGDDIWLTGFYWTADS